ncbi:TCF25 [Symbiodinium necroappetens]|uniref:TCF25 protein n=1 Tax=Symbiodinium necroappetens TaxID=1628268 RepID=A0A812RDL6_9DINO|nr:TCF25 [Symbiodinium necroappetens]
MSSRQVRKLQKLRDGGSFEEEEEEEHSEVEAVTKASSAFGAFVDSDTESQEEAEVSPAPASAAVAKSADEAQARKTRRSRKGRKGRQVESQGEEAEPTQDESREAQVPAETAETAETETGALSLCRHDFSAETERQRVFGSGGCSVGQSGPGRRAPRPRGHVEGRTLHHRRLFLVSLNPNEPWAKPENSTRMVAKVDQDGAAVFDFEETPASSRDLKALRQIVGQEDPQLLQQYLQRNSFSLDGLLVMAEFHRHQGSPEQAREFVRRAVYTLECSLSPDFSPFQTTGVGPQALRPRVRLDVKNESEWSGWSWLNALWRHMHCLRGLGMHRTSLEVCKLLLACTLPRDPTRGLLFADFLCLRSRSFQVVESFATLPARYGLAPSQTPQTPYTAELGFAFPNIAYSLALCTQLARGQGSTPDLGALSNLPLDPILSGVDDDDWDQALRAHARLMRALLFFPGCLRPLLEECGVNLQSKPSGSESWLDLLAAPPFSNSMEFCHSQHASAHGRLCVAYAKLCGPLWKDAVKWLHACCARWARLHCSEVFVNDIEAARRSWASSRLALCEALEDYKDLLSDECAENPAPAPILERAMTARLHPPRDQNHLFAGAGGAGAHSVEPNMSLHTPAAILFFQSLLPWSELDQTGVQVSPLFWRDVFSGALAVAKGTGLFGLGAVADLGRAMASLWKLAADVAKEVEASQVQGRPARRPRKRLPMHTRSSEKDLTVWEDSPAPVYNPSQGMLVLQQEQWHERLTHDRVLDWSARLRAQKAKLQALAVPPEEPAPAVKLPLPVVQEVFDSLVEDPQDEIQARLEAKRQESLALQLELILANPPLLLQKAMKTAGPVKIRIAKVEASGPEDGSYIVYFEGCDSAAARVERRLKRAAPVLASALARRLLLGYVRDLTFVPVAYSSESQDAPSGTLWRSRRRVRKQQVVSAAQ